MNVTDSMQDPAWLETMYNNRALVPDFQAYLDRWAADSQRVRAQQQCHMDLMYGPDASQTLDVFAPAHAGPQGAPVLVFIHGGYWRSLDKSDHSFIAPPFTQSGMCVVVLNYALCPGTPEVPVTLPHIARQIEQALAWVATHVAEYGGDARRITVVGHSAGGLLAALSLTSAWPLVQAGLPDGLVRNALSISGVHDLQPLMHAPFVQSSLHLTQEQVMQCSPARLLAPAQGRLWCVAGGDESAEFQRQNGLMQQAWGSHYVPRCQLLPGLHHFSILDTLAQPDSDVHHMVQNLLRAPLD